VIDRRQTRLGDIARHRREVDIPQAVEPVRMVDEIQQASAEPADGRNVFSSLGPTGC